MNNFLRSKRFWVSLTLFLGLIWLSQYPFFIILGLAGLTLVSYPHALRPLKSYKFWIAIALLVIVVPLFTGLRDSRFLGIPYSSERLQQTLIMAFRGIGVFLLIQVLTMDIASQRFTRALRRLGLSRYEGLIDSSKRVVPNARRIFKSRWGQIKDERKQRGFRLTYFLDIVGFLFVDLIHLSEQLNQGEILDPQRPMKDLIEEIDNFPNPVLVVVSGASGQGKTRWLQSLVGTLIDDQHSVAGLLTRRKQLEIKDNQWDQWLWNIAGKEERRLSSMAPQDHSVQTDRFYISHDTLAWGNSILQDQQTLQANWMVIDEIGILEKKQGGFYPSFELINKHFQGHLVVAVRKSLIPELEEFLAESMPAIARRERYFLLV